MWFRNLQIFRLAAGWHSQLDALHDQLLKHAFQPCGSQDMKSRGWIPPRGDRLVHGVGGQWLLALGAEQKLLPASVVNQTTQSRAAAIEEAQGYRPGRKQMAELKEQIVLELLPRAFSRYNTTWVWLAPREGWLCIDAANVAKADEVLEVLAKSVDDLPLTRLKTELSPVSAMAGWLAADEAPAGFTIDRECELKAPGEEKSIVRYVRHPLDGEEIRAHLAAGKQPTRLALTFDDKVSLVLTEKLEVKRLAFLDVVKEEAERQAENADEIFDAEFALMSGELLRLLPALVEALGGEQKDGI
ncbi:MAG: recombination-associated protein RdgC [Deltaproteobacteria bacterium]|nr:recombination-associated protein RdgC [Deltaproteobacteria bacterium]